jgi:hypothetical protein
VSRQLATPLWVTFLLAAAVASCGRPDPLAGFAAPRTVHLAPDGRVLVTGLAEAANLARTSISTYG